MPRLPILLASALLVIGGCSSNAPTDEDRQLDQAAAALDANSADVNAAEIIDEPEGNAPPENSR